MEIFHHVAGLKKLDPKLLQTAIDYGIKLKFIPVPHHPEPGLFTFQISEAHPGWKEIKSLLEFYSAVDRPYTIFTDEEVRAAPWSWLGWRWEHGDIRPQDTFPSLPPTRKLLCPTCFRYEQYAPYRISADPKIGRNHFFSPIPLVEIFAISEVVHAFKQAGFTGFEDWDLMLNRKNIPTLFARQITVRQALPFPIQNQDHLLQATLCPDCGVPHYPPLLRGTYEYKAADIAQLDQDFYLSQEWTMNGPITWREILVSNRVAQCILDHKWKGVQLKAIHLV